MAVENNRTQSTKNAETGEFINKQAPLVGIVMGSDSDLPTMKKASDLLEKLGVPHETQILSAHRTPHEMVEYASSAKKRGLKVLIAGAGGSAHLPGMIASHTRLPVIGVPIETRLGGANALGSMIEMPPGVTLFVVGIGQAEHAGLGAANILALADEDLDLRLDQRFNNLGDEVRAKNRELQRLGTNGYLNYKQSNENLMIF